MRGSKLKPRSELLDQISRARSEQEVSEAEQAAAHYLQEYPDDPDVLAARQKLDERAAELRDPERAVDRLQGKMFVMVTIIVSASVSVALLLVGRGVVEAILVGLVVAVLVSWEIATVMAEFWVEFGKKAFHALKKPAQKIAPGFGTWHHANLRMVRGLAACHMRLPQDSLLDGATSESRLRSL